MLPDELVELAVGANPFKPPLALLDVAVDAEVSGLTREVLAVAYTAYGTVQLRTTVARANLDGFAHRVAQWLQYVVNQCAQGAHLVNARGIDYAQLLSGCGVAQLFQREVLTNSGRHDHRLY